MQAWIEGVHGPLPRDPSGTFAGFAASNRRENARRPEHSMRGNEAWRTTVRRPGRTLTAIAATALAAGCSAAATAHATADATSSAPAVTQAKVTGYKSGSAFLQSSGPVTVVLRGKAAAHLGQVLNSLPKGGTMQCMENELLYNITFAYTSPHKTIEVAGYACVSAVQVTEDGKTTLRTDSHCALLAAIRKILPASAVTTRQGC
jgi:hypothetical protein